MHFGYHVLVWKSKTHICPQKKSLSCHFKKWVWNIYFHERSNPAGNCHFIVNNLIFKRWCFYVSCHRLRCRGCQLSGSKLYFIQINAIGVWCWLRNATPCLQNSFPLMCWHQQPQKYEETGAELHYAHHVVCFSDAISKHRCSKPTKTLATTKPLPKVLVVGSTLKDLFFPGLVAQGTPDPQVSVGSKTWLLSREPICSLIAWKSWLCMYVPMDLLWFCCFNRHLSCFNDFFGVNDSRVDATSPSLHSGTPGGHSGHLPRSASAVPGGLSPVKGSFASSLRKSKSLGSLESLDESLRSIHDPNGLQNR